MSLQPGLIPAMSFTPLLQVWILPVRVLRQHVNANLPRALINTKTQVEECCTHDSA